MYKQDVNERDPRLEVKFSASQRGDAAVSSTDSPNLLLSSTDLRCFMSADLAVCSFQIFRSKQRNLLIPNVPLGNDLPNT